jgi:hypothetical protein
MPSEPVDAMDVEAVHEAVSRAAERARAGEGPTYLEFRTYRYRGHSMSDPQKYRTKEEVEKLFRWEYKVIETPADQSAGALESQLSELGADGWECFHIHTQTSGLVRITCKRKPKSALSYLKYIPGL